MGAHAQSHHSEKEYIKIWAILLGLLVVSILGPMLGNRWITLITAFGIAVVKATMVAAWFMHLNIEKRFVWYMLLSMLLFVALFWAGSAADVMKNSGQNWIKIEMPAQQKGDAAHGSH